MSAGSRAGTEKPRPRRLDLLARRVGHKFADPSLLRQAMIHRSHLNENPGEPLESNERLEFLGDAVLDSVIARRLFDDYPQASEGWLTEVRARLVRNETLGRLAQQYDLGDYILTGRGVEAQDGRDRPALLARALEAVIGAVYLDGGLQSVRRFIFRVLAEDMEIIAVAGLERDPKSVLQQACQAHWRATPSYHTLEAWGPAHEREFRVEVRVNGDPLGVGEGRSKQAAEMAAAEVALRSLPEDAIV